MTVTIMQDLESRPNSNDSYVAAVRYCQIKKAQTLVASTPGQNVTFTIDNNERLASLTLLIGATNSVQNSVVPTDGISGLGLFINGTPVIPQSTDPYFVRADWRYSNKFGLLPSDTLPSSGANGNCVGVVGMYRFVFNDDADHVNLGQFPILNQSSGDNYFICDTNTTGVFALVIAEGYKGAPTRLKKGAESSPGAGTAVVAGQPVAGTPVQGQ
jgi:hypothetical protein